ncbi:MAG: hypothetical protein J7M14_04145, partial [Planctomycetes bacterium]|nr:hypothetical protein [Planctomycetota bacterium]
MTRNTTKKVRYAARESSDVSRQVSSGVSGDVSEVLHALLFGRLGVFLAALLVAYCIWNSWKYGRMFVGIDFYQQPWCVPQVRAVQPEREIWSKEARLRMGWKLLEMADAEGVGIRQK